MIRKLRLKFICVNMLIVTLMLTAIFGMVYHLTRQGLETQSEAMLQSVASDAFHPNRPGSPPQEVHLPFFVLELDGNGGLTASGGGYYDLTDQEFLKTLADVATDADAPAGVLREYGLRYCRSVTPRGERIAFADMSSELKTPLTVIMTNAELLNSPDFDETRRSQFAAHILTMSRQMRQLIEEMLDLARTDSGLSTLIFSQVDLSRLISDAVLPFEPVFFEAGLTLAVDIQPGLTVRGSQQHLRQTVDILLDNARKYAAPSGEISVTLTRCGGRCRLAVSNPGPEISKADLQNIFKRFYRADEAHTQRGSYGLGLSIARNIILRHRGRIWAESKNGRNTFFVELPVK